MKPQAKPTPAAARARRQRPASESRSAQACSFLGFAFSPVLPVLVSSLIGILIILPL